VEKKGLAQHVASPNHVEAEKIRQNGVGERGGPVQKHEAKETALTGGGGEKLVGEK